MVTFERILCPVDLSELSLRPLAYAGTLAGWYGARLTALHVVPTFDPMEVRDGALFDPVHLVQPMPREEVLEALRGVVETAGLAAGRVTLAAEAGDAATTIVEQSVATRADLLVMGTHGRSGFDRFLLGSVTEKVMRKAPCPVLTVPPHASPPAPGSAGEAIDTILCPIDFSPSAAQAVGFALDLARQAGASVNFLHAIEWLAEEEPRVEGHFDVPEFRQHLASAAGDRMKAVIAQETRPGDKTTHIVVSGRAYREVLRIASETPTDLIVMGAQGRGGAGLTLFGSTTQQVVRRATCPVLTVRAAPGPV